LPEISNEEKLKIILKHINLEISEKGENIAIKEMRKHIGWYVKSMPEASKIRERVNKIEEKEELIDCLIEYFK